MVITIDELKIIASKEKLNVVLLEKDYLLTLLLYYIKDIDGLLFKGGTALNKIYLKHQRLSEDLDFSLSLKAKDAEKQIREKLKGTIFRKISRERRSKFIRLTVEYKLFHETSTILIDLNENASIIEKPKKVVLPHFYNIPQFEVNCLDIKEMIAEKVRAICQRYKPRDYYDLYHIVKKKLPVSKKLIAMKFKEYGIDFEPGVIFKNTNKVYNEWNEDLSYLVRTKLEFTKVMKTLKDYFGYKQ